jgi:hypothetical protein
VSDLNGCSEARAMLDCYTAALIAYHKTQDGLLAGMSRSDPRYEEVHQIQGRAFGLLVRARKVYWEHVTEHKCRKPVSPTDLAYEKN